MRIRDHGDQWVSIQEDLRRLEREEPEQGEELEERIPCPDESCVGCLGEDGRCRVCGTGSEGVPGPGLEPLAMGQEHNEEAADLDSQEPQEPGWEERVPCADESCVGSVDGEGYCRICGLRWKDGGYAEGEPLVYREEALR